MAGEISKTAIQINGRRTFGPPNNWEGPAPSMDCEVFINRIPPTMADAYLLQVFQKFGQIYEFRLMMDFNEMNRGFGFIRYTNSESACKAIETMKYFLVRKHTFLCVRPSHNKSRLFVSNIPKNLKKEEIEEAFREVFPNMKRIIMHQRISDGNLNRGFVFVDFVTHEDALNAKKNSTPGCIRKWGCDLKVSWAYPEFSDEYNITNNIKTLFIRSIDPSIPEKEIKKHFTKFIKPNYIERVKKRGEFAFIEFINRKTAEWVLKNMKDLEFNGHSLMMEWAQPPRRTKLDYICAENFNRSLYLMCIANGWDPHIIIFGRINSDYGIQNAAVFIKSSCNKEMFFVEIPLNVLDIQSRICEVVFHIIKSQGGLKNKKYILKIYDNNAYLVGELRKFGDEETYIKSHLNIPLGIEEITVLNSYLSNIEFLKYERLLQMYESCCRNRHLPYVHNSNMHNRVLAAMNLSYFQHVPPGIILPKREHNQILLALCDSNSFSNYVINPSYCTHRIKYSRTEIIKSFEIILRPLDKIQRGTNGGGVGIYYKL